MYVCIYIYIYTYIYIYIYIYNIYTIYIIYLCFVYQKQDISFSKSSVLVSSKPYAIFAICMYIYIYIYIYPYMYVCMYVCMYVSMYVCMYINVSVQADFPISQCFLKTTQSSAEKSNVWCLKKWNISYKSMGECICWDENKWAKENLWRYFV